MQLLLLTQEFLGRFADRSQARQIEFKEDSILTRSLLQLRNSFFRLLLVPHSDIHLGIVFEQSL